MTNIGDDMKDMENRKKVLIMHPELVCGGAEKVLLEMLRALDKTKFEVTLLLRNKAMWDDRIPQGVETCYMMQSNPTKRGAFVVRLYKYVLIFFPSLIYLLLGIHKKFDLAIAYHEPMIWFLPCVKAKRVSWVHSDYSTRQYVPEVKTMTNKTGRLAKMITKRRRNLLQSLDKIVMVAKTLIPAYIEKNGVDLNKITVCYNVSNDQEIITLSEEVITDKCWINYNENHLVIVGRIHHEKAMHRLIPLAKHLYNANINAKIYIIGDGNDRTRLENLIKENKLEEAFEILGYQENPYKYIKNAKLLLCCSPSEAYCTTTKESILLETPFVTTRCSGMEEQIGKGKAGLIAPNGEDTLAPFVIKALSDENLYMEMKQDIKLRHNALSCENAIKAIESMLIDCCKN